MDQQRYLLALPPRITTLEELRREVSDRFHRLGEILRTFGVGAPLDFSGQRARNLQRGVDDSDAVTVGQMRDSLARLRSSVAPQAASSGQINLGITGAAIELVQVTLDSSPYAITVTGATAGLVVALMLEQDAAGNRVVTWPATWRGVQGLQPDPTASTYSAALIGFLSPTEGRLLAAPIRGVPLT